MVAAFIAGVGYGGQVGAEEAVGSAAEDVSVTVATGRVGGLYHRSAGPLQARQ